MEKTYETPTSSDGKIRFDVMLLELIDSVDVRAHGRFLNLKATGRTKEIYKAVQDAAMTAAKQ